MFVDKAVVTAKAGSGGDGIVSFRHEKFISKGGPDGGDGGNGGDIIFVASRNQNTLANFRYQKLLTAESGKPGFKSKKHGKSGQDLTVAVPVGTVVADEKGAVLADLVQDGQTAVIAKGGRGGFGNAHFVSSTRQAPRVAEKGEAGQELNLNLELKMIADVGLIGLPNAGKSTLLASISQAKPEVADYPFTTLRPYLGVVDIDHETSLLFADIPGLIEGASQGKGLGDEFLRHVERTSVLIHLIDIYQDDIATAYQTIQNELKAYNPTLAKRPQKVVLTKIEGLDEDMVQDSLAKLTGLLPKNTPVAAISAVSGQGVRDLLFAIKRLVEKRHQALEKQAQKSELPIITLPEDDSGWRIKKAKNGFEVTGTKIERLAERTKFGDYHGEQRLRDIMRKMGIMQELERRGIQANQVIRIAQKGSLRY